jgi:hypothetical protein
VKFEVKVGNEFELKFETDTNKTPFLILTKGVIVLIIIAAIYGIRSGDYHVFDSTRKIIDKSLDIVGTAVKAANIKNTS